MFNPHDWYWLADDGRIFSSARGELISKNDGSFKKWEDAGNLPTRWPEDDNGEQNNASLGAVLSVYGLEIDRKNKMLKEVSTKAQNILDAGCPFSEGHVAMDDASRADLGAMATTASLALSGAVSWPSSYARGWISIENNRIEIPTPQDGISLAATVGDYYARLKQHARDLKDAILAAADDKELDKIDVNSGWPL